MTEDWYQLARENLIPPYTIDLHEAIDTLRINEPILYTIMTGTKTSAWIARKLCYPHDLVYARLKQHKKNHTVNDTQGPRAVHWLIIDPDLLILQAFHRDFAQTIHFIGHDRPTEDDFIIRDISPPTPTDSIYDEVLNILSPTEPQTTQEVADKLDIRYHAAYRRLRTLLIRGLVSRELNLWSRIND
jgi:hypothetical protein